MNRLIIRNCPNYFKNSCFQTCFAFNKSEKRWPNNGIKILSGMILKHKNFTLLTGKTQTRWPTGIKIIYVRVNLKTFIWNRRERTRLAKKVTNDASKLDFHVTLLKRVSRKDILLITRYRPMHSEVSDRKSTSLTNNFKIYIFRSLS